MLRLGKFIIDYRERHKISYRKFAKLSGLSVTYIQSLERGHSYRSTTPISPTLTTLKSLARAMNYTLEELLTLVGELDGKKPIDNSDIREINQLLSSLSEDEVHNALQILKLAYPNADSRKDE